VRSAYRFLHRRVSEADGLPREISFNGVGVTVSSEGEEFILATASG